jgi:hypothetical protein
LGSTFTNGALAGAAWDAAGTGVAAGVDLSARGATMPARGQKHQAATSASRHNKILKRTFITNLQLQKTPEAGN